MSVHKLAVAGFQKGPEYNDSRPSYSEEAVRFITSQLTEIKVKEEHDVRYDVLELGAGTGLFTRKVLSVLPKTVCYLATDPSEGFLKTLLEKSPDVETRICAASAIPLPDNSVKMIVCAQCFHWFANSEALDEMRRVLVHGGKLVLIWNRKDESAPWLREVLDYLQTVGGRPQYTGQRYGEQLEGHAGFNQLHALVLPGVHFKRDEDGMLQHLSTISVIAQLSGDEKEAAIAGMRSILHKHDDTRCDVITLPLTTDLYVYVCNKDA